LPRYGAGPVDLPGDEDRPILEDLDRDKGLPPARRADLLSNEFFEGARVQAAHRNASDRGDGNRIIGRDSILAGEVRKIAESQPH
jgi:hypothetical protein